MVTRLWQVNALLAIAFRRESPYDSERGACERCMPAPRRLQASEARWHQRKGGDRDAVPAKGLAEGGASLSAREVSVQAPRVCAARGAVVPKLVAT